MHDAIPSLQVIRSQQMGGAENWFARFVRALHDAGAPVEALVRSGSELARHGHLAGLPVHCQRMLSVRDPFSRYAARHLIQRLGLPLVQTYMERATVLVRLPRHGASVHLCRLGSNHRDLSLLRHAHAWVANTRHLRDHLVAEGFPAERVFQIYNFAQPAAPADAGVLAQLRAQYRLDEADLLLLCASRMVGFKGHAGLLAAFARLPREIAGRRPRLLLVGDGPLRAGLQAQARQLGVDQRIVWAGWQQYPAQWFHLADLVVFPSQEVEVLGNVILEAWSYRKPLVATAFRGARELVRHGEDGWLLPCEDPAALAEGIRRVAGDPALAAALVGRGAARVAAEFSPAAIVAQYQDLYRHLVEHRP